MSENEQIPEINKVIISAYENQQDVLPMGATEDYLRGLKGEASNFSQFGLPSERAKVLNTRLLTLKSAHELWKSLLRGAYVSGADGLSETSTHFPKELFRFLFNMPAVVPKKYQSLFKDFAEYVASQKNVLLKERHIWNEEENLFSRVEGNEYLNNLLLEDWISFLQKASPNLLVEFVDDLFIENIQLFETIKTEQEKLGVFSTIDQNVPLFLEGQGFSPVEEKVLWYFEHFPVGHNVPNLLTFFSFKIIGFNESCVLIDQVLKIPLGTTNKVIKDGGLLDQSQLIGVSQKTPKTIFDQLKITYRHINAIDQSHSTSSFLWAELLQDAQKVEPQSNLTEQDFSFLGQDLLNIKEAMKSDAKLKTLIIAKEGQGSTALINTLTKSIEKILVFPQEKKGEAMDLRQIRQEASLVKNSVLLIDKDQEDFVAQKTGLKNGLKFKASEIWVINDAKDLVQEDLETFDLIVNLAPMPFSNRQKLSRSLFDNEELADNIAKSCPTPKLIHQIKSWSVATNQTSWRELAVIIAGMQKSTMDSKQKESHLPIQLYQQDPNGKGFESVIGCSDVVSQAQKIVSGLKNPDAFKKRGLSPPKGILLTGGPGLGKTHLVRAMAHEAGVPLIVASSSALAEDPQKITDVFHEAKNQAPCILFLDEIDALGTTSKSMFSPPDPKRQAILNRLLAEIDGFESLSDVMVIGATHHYQSLDEALVRSGRLGWNVKFQNPNRASRVELLQHYLPDIEGLNWDKLSRASAGMSPADISEVASRSQLLALIDDADAPTTNHVLKSIDEINWGVQQDQDVITEEIYRTAVHEAGHAIFAWQQQKDIDRVSVQPSSMALGFVRHFKEEGKIHLTRSEAENKIILLLGGLVAEEVVLGERAFGASSDLEKVREIVTVMSRVEGMFDMAVAGVDWSLGQEPSEIIKDELFNLENDLIKDLKSKATQVMKNNKNFIEALAQHLVIHREISGEELDHFIKKNKHLVHLGEQNLELDFIGTNNIKEKKERQGDLFPPKSQTKARMG